MKPDSLRNILPGVLERLAGAGGGTENRWGRAWEEAADAGAKRHTAVAGFSKGRLLVNVDSPVWAFQLNFKKNELLKRLKARYPDLVAINFRIGKIH
ncbi:MAG: DUF721 domain-containing protein [Candidatus Omnitrophota bacterium]